jgi:AraC-like DNA-binding protein
LRCDIKLRSFWAELPRQAFASRFDSKSPPLMARLDLRRGLGRIAVELCATLAVEGADLDPKSRTQFGEHFMDILALAMSGDPGRQPAADISVRRARLRSVKNYIDAHLSDPRLSLSKIAEKNGISLRYLHLLFRPTDMSVSEWVRMRRLQRCYDLLTSPLHRTQSVTEIAYAMGFSSSSHFSNLFRAHFGLRPSDVRASPRGPGPRTRDRYSPTATRERLLVLGNAVSALGSKRLRCRASQSIVHQVEWTNEKMSAADVVGLWAFENRILWKRGRANEGRLLDSRKDRALDRGHSVLRFLGIS